ncbi:MAG TPA: MqnA/MqnD/SBP family protein, partial [Bacteroidota bacterium]
WAVDKELPADLKKDLGDLIERSLADSAGHFAEVGELAGKQIGLTGPEIEEYLEGFQYTLGEREREAMKEFRLLVDQSERVSMVGGS